MDISRVYFRLPFVICVKGKTQAEIQILVEKFKRYFRATYRFSEEIFNEALAESIELAGQSSNFLYDPYVGVHNKRSQFLTIHVSDDIRPGHQVIDEDILDALAVSGCLQEVTNEHAA